MLPDRSLGVADDVLLNLFCAIEKHDAGEDAGDGKGRCSREHVFSLKSRSGRDCFDGQLEKVAS